jgi:hypothetical protein
MNRKLDFYLEWLATAVCIVGALFTSLNYYPLGPILLNVGTILVIYTVGLIVKLI